MLVSQPPMVGPIAGAKVAVVAKPANPMARLDGGSIETMIVKASGISTPPKKPCKPRNRIISGRLVAWPQATDRTRNMIVLASR